MAGTWDFGGAYANTAETLQRTDADRQKLEMAKLAFPSELAHQQSVTRLNSANAAVAEYSLDARKRMAELTSGMQLNDPDKPQSYQIMQLAGAAMKAGDPTTAQSLLLHAAQIRTQEGRQAADTARAAKAQAEMQMKKADRWASLLSTVKSQEDLDRVRMLWMSEFGEEAPAMRYDPRLVEMMREKSISMRDRIYADHTKFMEGIARARLGETASFHAQSLGIRRAAEARRERADETKAKNAGKDVGAPQKSEVEAASDLLAREGKSKGLDPQTSRTAAFDLASRARAKRRQNPGLDAGEAMQQALMEQIGEGYYTTKKGTSFFGLRKTETAAYGKPGSNPDRALPVPQDRSKLKANNYYLTPKGSLLYLGDGKWQAPSQSSGGGSSDDEDEEE